MLTSRHLLQDLRPLETPWNDEVVGYYHPNVRKLLLEDIEIARAPGAFEYNNYNTSYLGLVIERTTGKTVSRYLEEKLWSQIMEYDALFSIDSKASGFEYMPSRLIARAIDYARFGRLYLNNGVWEGKRIISENWVQQSTLENKQSYNANDPDWIGLGKDVPIPITVTNGGVASIVRETISTSPMAT